MTLTQTYLCLGAAIVAEVMATTLLKTTANFTRLWPSLAVIVGYGFSFYLLTFALTVLPTGIAYAIWSGVGIILISAAGWLLHGQRLDAPAIIGLGLIIAGVVVVNVFSKSVGH
jgi:small multidrug resistance pump